MVRILESPIFITLQCLIECGTTAVRLGEAETGTPKSLDLTIYGTEKQKRDIPASLS